MGKYIQLFLYLVKDLNDMIFIKIKIKSSCINNKRTVFLVSRTLRKHNFIYNFWQAETGIYFLTLNP